MRCRQGRAKIEMHQTRDVVSDAATHFSFSMKRTITLRRFTAESSAPRMKRISTARA